MNGVRVLDAMKHRLIRSLFLSLCSLWLVAGASPARSAEVSIPALRGLPGESIDIPVMVDEVDNMAGVKLVMKYDAELLTFKRGSKTGHTDSLMHIVNSKKPGVLIAVMAGARGIRGKAFPILTLTFEIKKDLKGNHTTRVEITEVEMMSDQLKAIPCGIRVEPLVIPAQRPREGGAAPGPHP